MRVPWPARRSNQSILKEISPEYSLEGLVLKLKLQNFSHLMQRTDSLEKPYIGKDRRQEKGMTEDEMNMSLSELWELVIDREAWHAAIHGVAELNTPECELNWTCR